MLQAAEHVLRGASTTAECGQLETAARKRAEQDAMLLANRIRLLRQEEERTKRKIFDTERRTQEVLAARRGRAVRQQSREAELRRREAEEEELRGRRRQERGKQQRRILQSAEVLAEHRAGLSQEVRQERLSLQRCLEAQREEAQAQARARHASAQRSAQQGLRAGRAEAKQEAARCLAQERLDREHQAHQASLELVARMEREEAELMQGCSARRRATRPPSGASRTCSCPRGRVEPPHPPRVFTPPRCPAPMRAPLQAPPWAPSSGSGSLQASLLHTTCTGSQLRPQRVSRRHRRAQLHSLLSLR